MNRTALEKELVTLKNRLTSLEAKADYFASTGQSWRRSSEKNDYRIEETKKEIAMLQYLISKSE